MARNFEILKREAPIKIGNLGQNFFRQSFEKQGWTDTSFTAWQQVQRRIPGTSAYKYPKKNASDRHKRNILIGLRTKGGMHLRDSVNRSLKVATFTNITWSVPQKYAAAHNYGLRVKGFKMPQRKFMGNSATLLNGVHTTLITALRKLHSK